MARISIKLARSAKQRAIELLSDLPGLVGIGVIKVDDGYAVRVNLDAEPSGPNRRKVPKTIDGVPVAVEVTGPIRAR